MSYAGAATIEELWANAEFIRITPAGQKESGAHDVSVI
jgi:IMP dehydrogenase